MYDIKAQKLLKIQDLIDRRVAIDKEIEEFLFSETPQFMASITDDKEIAFDKASKRLILMIN